MEAHRRRFGKGKDIEMLYRTAAIALALTVAGCTGQIEGVATTGDAHGQIIVLEGDELARELFESPAHRANETFGRIGAIWEADRPGAIELSVSPDGTAWSPWTPIVVEHIELELDMGNFVGQLELDEPATFYRVRGTDGYAEYVRLELLSTTLSDGVEDGDGSGPMFSQTIGSAEVHTRSEWGAAATRCTSGLGNAYRMAIHHTETPTSDSVSPQARLRGIQSYHQNTRGWCDIGYHYLMSRDGRLWEGRPGHLRGAHAGGANTGNVGIAAMGQHSSTPITDTQVDALASLIHGIAEQHDISIDRTAIKGHRQYKPTSCPGHALYAQLDEIVSRAANGGGTPQDPPPDSGSVTVKGVLFVGADTSDRIEGATVTLGNQTTTTSAVGLWQFDNVSEGSYTVTASAAGYQTRTIARDTYANPTWSSFGLSVEEQTMTGSAVLQGVVYHSANSQNRIAFATIELSTGHTMTADGNGFYRFVDLPAGPVTVTASAADWVSGSVDRDLFDGETAWGSVELISNAINEEVGGPGSTCTPCANYDFLCCNVPANDMYYLTSYEGGGTMACGGSADGVSYYATSWVRWSCGAKLRITNPANNSCVVVEVKDAGPATWVENNADGPILDASTQVCRDLFNSSSCGWSDARTIEVIEVAETTPTGPCS
jgi:hypothetical protein